MRRLGPRLHLSRGIVGLSLCYVGAWVKQRMTLHIAYAPPCCLLGRKLNHHRKPRRRYQAIYLLNILKLRLRKLLSCSKSSLASSRKENVTMKTSTLILNHLLPRNAVELGRLVTNIHDPMQDYCQPDLLPLGDDAISVQRLENFSSILENTKGSNLFGFLTQILSGIWSVSSEVTTDIAATVYETRQLGNCEDILHAACKLASVRIWLERAIRRKRNVYVISGLKVLIDTRVRQSVVKSSNRGGSVQVPGALIAAAATIPIPVGDILDIGVEKTYQRDFREEGEYMASGEHIFAIQYRKVKMGKFSTSAVDPDYLLGGSRWKIFLSSRGGTGRIEEDGVDVEAGGSVYANDIRKRCEHFEVDDEEILFCPGNLRMGDESRSSHKGALIG